MRTSLAPQEGQRAGTTIHVLTHDKLIKYHSGMRIASSPVAHSGGFKTQPVNHTLMVTDRRRRFIHGVVAWMLGSIVVLATLDALTLELTFVISLIGLLVVVELTAPFNITPRWRRRLIPVIVAGLIGFSYIVIQRILEILPEGVI
jgi:hypothetical protein